MILVLDNLQTDDLSWSGRHRSDLDRRADIEAHVEPGMSAGNRAQPPSQRTLARLGFANGLCRPNYTAQRLRNMPNARGDETSSDWRPL